MKKNSKFLLIYIAILFSFALVLILFAGLTQNNYAKELADANTTKINALDEAINSQVSNSDIDDLFAGM